MLLIILGAIILIVAAIGIIFIKTSPQFGGEHTEERKARYSAVSNYRDGKFYNLRETKMEMGFLKFMSVLGDYIAGVPHSAPKVKLPAVPLDSLAVIANQPQTKITWLGHSAFVMEIGSKNVLIDPMLGDVPSPHPMLGKARFSALPIQAKELASIDFVLISHDHYDHLDYESIIELKERVGKFYVPMGVGAHLVAWGVEATKITELAWWDEVTHDGITLVLTPARHFSGRGLTDRFSTLWGSWVIKSNDLNIYFSGDSGYDSHFKEIGSKYGPFDFAMMECGQYDERWDEIHMFPEETAQAAQDLQAKTFMPIHWGSFVLALHSWTDPIERVTQKASELGIDIATPQIGEPVIINQHYPDSDWWKTYRAD